MTSTTTSAFPEANRESGTRSSAFLSAKTVTREALKVLDDLDMQMHPGAVRKLVRGFITDGCTTPEQVMDRFITYLDPTGETAVRNVHRDRGY